MYHVNAQGVDDRMINYIIIVTDAGHSSSHERREFFLIEHLASASPEFGKLQSLRPTSIYHFKRE